MNRPNQHNIRDIHIIGRNTREQIIQPELVPEADDFLLAGISDASSDFYFLRDKPYMDQILACVGGEGKVFIDGKMISCTKGNAYITPANVFHKYHALPDTAWQLVWVQLRAGTFLGRIEKPKLIEIDAGNLFRIIQGYYTETVSSRNPDLYRCWLKILKENCLRIIGGEPAIDIRLVRLWHEVGAHLSTNWTLDILAEKAQLSTEHLRRLCVKTYGRSPIRYVAQLRMQRAVALLENTSMRIEDIALAVGYENQFAFSTAFHRIMGTTPGKIRQKKAPF